MSFSGRLFSASLENLTVGSGKYNNLPTKSLKHFIPLSHYVKITVTGASS